MPVLETFVILSANKWHVKCLTHRFELKVSETHLKTPTIIIFQKDQARRKWGVQGVQALPLKIIIFSSVKKLC